METWAKSVEAVTLFMENLPRARAFYEKVLGVPAGYEDQDSAAHRFGGLIVNLLDVKTAAARSRSRSRTTTRWFSVSAV